MKSVFKKYVLYVFLSKNTCLYVKKQNKIKITIMNLNIMIPDDTVHLKVNREHVEFPVWTITNDCREAKDFFEVWDD
jgi:hypothetical protein